MNSLLKNQKINRRRYDSPLTGSIRNAVGALVSSFRGRTRSGRSLPRSSRNRSYHNRPDFAAVFAKLLTPRNLLIPLFLAVFFILAANLFGRIRDGINTTFKNSYATVGPLEAHDIPLSEDIHFSGRVHSDGSRTEVSAELITISEEEVKYKDSRFAEKDFQGVGGNETGAGLPLKDRENEVIHVIKEGETLSDIAERYKIPIDKIVIYNRILDPDTIHYGAQIRIPSYAQENKIAKQVLTAAELVAVDRIEHNNSPLPTPKLHISAEKQLEGTAITASFAIDDAEDISYKNFYWDLGDGRTSKNRNAVYTYTTPGTYKVSLRVRDAHNRNIKSNELFIDVPYPATYRDDSHKFLTVNNVGDIFDLEGAIVQVFGYNDIDGLFKMVPSEPDIKNSYSYRALREGYYALTVQSIDSQKTIYLFVSPQESVHNENENLLWYRTQAFTGTQSNCGPTTVSMGVAWATGEYLPVINVRQYLGWTGDGGTSFNQITTSLNKFGAKASMDTIRDLSELFSIIDSGDLAVILFNTQQISKSKGDPARDFYGKHYPDDSEGHYVIVKGYTTDHKYLIVNDPLPKDWSRNAARYGDGISMLGRNRYFLISEMKNAIKSNSIIRISR
ncbi:MAG: LysM peptidoglycan-binding domain-containing protein [Spirochaetales bacterium]|nr:LysM peptidoglycan-binding domain-containing protein [Spirochaetales bacterium]